MSLVISIAVMCRQDRNGSIEYWQVRLEPNSAGVPNRTVVGYKEVYYLDPNPNPALITRLWRDLGRPEQTLIGVQYTSGSAYPPSQPLIVQNTNNLFYAGSGLTDGTQIPNLIGYEVDRTYNEYTQPLSTNFTILGTSPFTNSADLADTSQAVIWQYVNGAWVFGSGTMSWSWALGRTENINLGIQQLTRNILSRLLIRGNATPTPPPPTPTSAPTSTNVPMSTPTNTSVPSTATPTPLPPTLTPTSTPVQLPTATSTPGTGTCIFPSVTVQDNFNRPDGTSLLGSWFGGISNFAVTNNQLAVMSDGLMVFNATYGSSQEAFVKVASVNPASSAIRLILKLQDGNTGSPHILVEYQPSQNNVRVLTYNSGYVERASTALAVQAGDIIGARALSSGTVEVYQNGNKVLTADSSAWPNNAIGGYTGVWTSNAVGAILDDFGAGSVTCPTSMNASGSAESKSAVSSGI